MDANRLTDPPVSPPHPASRAPALGHAIALIALYFALQLAVGSALALGAGVIVALREGGAPGDIIPLGRHWLG